MTWCWNPGNSGKVWGRESLQLGLCLVTSLGWGCGMLTLCSKAQGRKLEGRGGWIGRWGKEKGPRADSLMLWPRAQVRSSWPHQRRNRCKTSQSVSKWEECQPWFLMPKEWKINNNHSYDLRSSCFIPKHFTERLVSSPRSSGPGARTPGLQTCMWRTWNFLGV